LSPNRNFRYLFITRAPAVTDGHAWIATARCLTKLRTAAKLYAPHLVQW